MSNTEISWPTDVTPAPIPPCPTCNPEAYRQRPDGVYKDQPPPPSSLLLKVPFPGHIRQRLLDGDLDSPSQSPSARQQDEDEDDDALELEELNHYDLDITYFGAGDGDVPPGDPPGGNGGGGGPVVVHWDNCPNRNAVTAQSSSHADRRYIASEDLPNLPPDEGCFIHTMVHRLSIPMSEEVEERFRGLVDFVRGQHFQSSANWADASLQDLFIRCHHIGRSQYGHLFIDMINLIQLVARFSSVQHQYAANNNNNKRMSYMQVVENYLAYDDADDDKGVLLSTASPRVRKSILNKRRGRLEKAVGYGRRYVQLASGGTVYLLILIAIKHLKTDIQESTREGEIFWLANILRRPYTKVSCLSARTRDTIERIRRGIIPTLNYLRRMLPLEFGAMVSSEFRAKFNVSEQVRCDDILASNGFFDSIPTKTLQNVPRNYVVWSALMQPVPTDVAVVDMDQVTKRTMLDNPAQSNPSTVTVLPSTSVQEEGSRPVAEFVPDEANLEGVEVYKVPINMAAPANLRQPYPTWDRAARDDWNSQERKKAYQRVIVPSVDDLVAHMNDNFKDGVRKPDAPYVEVERAAFDNAEVLLKSIDDSLVAMLVGNMPDDIRSSLRDNLKAALAIVGFHNLESYDSVLDALKPFICMHFSTFNRCGSRGDDAPTDIHPLLLRREGGRVNHHQFVPYVAKELKENYPVYRSLCESLERMFQWISMKIRQRLPDMHKELVMMAEVMPQSNPAYPFTGFVVNINVATKAHRDANDFYGCALIVLGEHQGGELCLYEPGLVLPLREGDLFVFPSGRITHFNLLYKGERGSIVCHSDFMDA